MPTEVNLNELLTCAGICSPGPICLQNDLCRYVHHVMGVCCIVFDIDGMLFEFFINFLNIEKNKILRFFFHFMFSSLMLFPTLKKKKLV